MDLNLVSRNPFTPDKKKSGNNKANVSNLDFLQSKIITSTTDAETELKLNLWLARKQYKKLQTVSLYTLPVGGGKNRREPMFTAVVFYYPTTQDAVQIQQHAINLIDAEIVNQSIEY